MSQNKHKKVVLVDLEFFESRRQVGEDFVRTLVEVFGQEAPKLINNIKITVEKQSEKELAELGHKLKGMCLNVGASALSQIGKEIEMNADRISTVFIENLVKKADSVFEGTLSEMNRLVK